MTLILCAANEDQVILVSDRRLTWNGQTTDEEWNKATTVILRDARLAVAFTGIAWTGTFNTRRWLEEAIMKSAAPDYTMEATVSRLRERASEDFKKLQLPDPKHKRLSIIIAGYQYSDDKPRCYCYLISNFQNFEDFQVRDTGYSDEFTLSYIREERPSTEPIAMIAFAGFDKGVTEAEKTKLFTLLKERKPVRALEDKAVDIVQKAAKSAKSHNLIGEQCTSIVLPQDPTESATSRYHSAKNASTIYTTSHIEARHLGAGVFVIDSPEVTYQDRSGRPVIAQVPKVGPNWPCPCGSTLKYKKCHGARGG